MPRARVAVRQAQFATENLVALSMKGFSSSKGMIVDLAATDSIIGIVLSPPCALFSKGMAVMSVRRMRSS